MISTEELLELASLARDASRFNADVLDRKLYPARVEQMANEILTLRPAIKNIRRELEALRVSMNYSGLTELQKPAYESALIMALQIVDRAEMDGKKV